MITPTLVQSIPPGAGAAEIAGAIEAEIGSGGLAPGARLPAVRELARALTVSPGTVAAAYRVLKQRGFVVAARSLGTSVAPRPPARVRALAELPAGVRDLRTGNPDPLLLPPLRGALERVDGEHRLYGVEATLAELAAAARDVFASDGIEGEVAVTGGALDAVERLLQTELRVGDPVVVEDPSWSRIADLVRALGLVPAPVAVDRRGLVPDRLDDALRRGARAVIATPRGQNPTGAAVDAERSRALRDVLASRPAVLVVEDDYLAGVAGAPYVPLHEVGGRFAVVRSLSKVLGPDLRIALVAGDPLTISRLEGRQRLGPGWVSHVLQQLAAALMREAARTGLLARAEETYAVRRLALRTALAAHGIEADGDSGFGVWVPLADEAAAVQELLVRGWAVSPGERFRFDAPPGIRITTSTLEPPDARRLADALAALGRTPATTYAG